jgi:hypothetical protein
MVTGFAGLLNASFGLSPEGTRVDSVSRVADSERPPANA